MPHGEVTNLNFHKFFDMDTCVADGEVTNFNFHEFFDFFISVTRRSRTSIIANLSTSTLTTGEVTTCVLA